MINPDELQEDLEEHQQHLQELIMRTKKQDTDIHELKQELERLKEDVADPEADAISPEDEASA